MWNVLAVEVRFAVSRRSNFNLHFIRCGFHGDIYHCAA
jgi:hypothetical protein